MQKFTQPLVQALSIYLVLAQRAAGEHVLPLFEYLWYNSADYSGQDACGVDAFDYGPMASSPAELLELINPNYFNCTWNNLDPKNSNSTIMPNGFISTNTNDWDEVLLSPSAVTTGTYVIDCYDEEDNVVQDSITAYPSYSCPDNTRLSYDNITREVGCTTTPTSCLADVVARDLAIPGFSWAGHIGLTETWEATSEVIEVLEVLPPYGIHLTYLHGNDSFESAGKYWGERYSLVGHPRLSLDTALNIVWAGTDQSAYGFYYTTGWNYYAGGSASHPEDCMFRCDSFIYYCFDIGGGIKIKETFEFPTDPEVLYNQFLCSADPSEPCKTNVDSITKQDIYNPSNEANTSSIKDSLALSIFNFLRPALATKLAQREHLPTLLEEFSHEESSNKRDLFALCLCFELAKIDPRSIDEEVRALLTDYMWQHRFLSQENFPLLLKEKKMKEYIGRPSCRWLSAFFSTKASTQEEKELGMVDYIDTEDSIVEKANLISGSQVAPLLSVPKRCMYGRLFQQAYNHDDQLTNRERDTLKIAMANIKFYSTDKAVQPNLLCQYDSFASQP